MELRVRKVCQTASGGSHVTIYESVVELITGPVRVEILGVHPADAPAEAVAAAREAITRGAEQVLQPLGLGASIRVSRLVVHDVDFKPNRFELHTREELSRLLAESRINDGTTEKEERPG